MDLFGQTGLILLLLGLFFSSFLIALSGALMPGPLLSATLAQSGRHGAWTGPRLILGHGILEALLILALFNGLAPLLTTPAAFSSIALAGSVILLWMGGAMLFGLGRLELDLSCGPAVSSPWGLPVSGALLSLANPYWSIWWATIGLGYILQASEAGWRGLVAFFTGHLLADLLWYSLVSYSMFKGQRFLSLEAYRAMVGTLGLFLIGFAGFFAFKGLAPIL
ncbi:MAG: LysE family transporter [bacterium]|nr:LysE family transporter [bacterium]